MSEIDRYLENENLLKRGESKTEDQVASLIKPHVLKIIREKPGITANEIAISMGFKPLETPIDPEGDYSGWWAITGALAILTKGKKPPVKKIVLNDSDHTFTYYPTSK